MTKNHALTDRQIAILTFMHDYQNNYGFVPAQGVRLITNLPF